MSLLAKKILRKHYVTKNKLIVFGTKCPLHPIDEDTLKSENLLSWSNDSSLLIDKYDVRCSLSEIPIVSHSNDPLNEDSEEEECNKERYFDLFEKQRIKELHKKRLQEESTLNIENNEVSNTQGCFSAVEFKYEESSKLNEKVEVPEILASHSPDTVNVNSDSSDDDNDIPYRCPPDLELGENIILPNTEREAATIERTALFIAKQGDQMEVLLKAKQATNRKFRFLDMDHQLQPFYRFLVSKIRSAEFIPAIRNKHHLRKDNNTDSGDVSVNGNGNMNCTTNNSTSKVDITNTAYYSLINKYRSKNETNTSNTNGQDDKKSSVIPKEDKPTTDQDVIEPTAGVDEEEYKIVYQQYYSYYYNYYSNELSKSPSSTSSADRALLVDVRKKECESAAIMATTVAMEQFVQNKQNEQLSEKTKIDNLKMLHKKCIILKFCQYLQSHGSAFESELEKRNSANGLLDFLQEDNQLYQLFQTFKDRYEWKDPQLKYPTWKDILATSKNNKSDDKCISQSGVGQLIKELNNPHKAGVVHVTSMISRLTTASDKGSKKYMKQVDKSDKPISHVPSCSNDIKAIRKRKAEEFLLKMKSAKNRKINSSPPNLSEEVENNDI